jgi:hypothetical protein
MKVSSIIKIQILLLCLMKTSSIETNLEKCKFCEFSDYLKPVPTKECWLVNGFNKAQDYIEKEIFEATVKNEGAEYTVKRFKICKNSHLVQKEIDVMIKLEGSKFTVKYRGCNKDADHYFIAVSQIEGVSMQDDKIRKEISLLKGKELLEFWGPAFSAAWDMYLAKVDHSEITFENLMKTENPHSIVVCNMDKAISIDNKSSERNGDSSITSHGRQLEKKFYPLDSFYSLVFTIFLSLVEERKSAFEKIFIYGHDENTLVKVEKNCFSRRRLHPCRDEIKPLLITVFVDRGFGDFQEIHDEGNVTLTTLFHAIYTYDHFPYTPEEIWSVIKRYAEEWNISWPGMKKNEPAHTERVNEKKINGQRKTEPRTNYSYSKLHEGNRHDINKYRIEIEKKESTNTHFKQSFRNPESNNPRGREIFPKRYQGGKKKLNENILPPRAQIVVNDKEHVDNLKIRDLTRILQERKKLAGNLNREDPQLLFFPANVVMILTKNQHSNNLDFKKEIEHKAAPEQRVEICSRFRDKIGISKLGENRQIAKVNI